MPRKFRNSVVSLLLLSLFVVQPLPGQIDSMATAGPEAPMVPVQPAAKDSTRINGVRLAIVSGGLLALVGTVHYYQQQGWWRDNRRSFHFQEDLKYGRGVDKLGHFYGAAAGAFIFRTAVSWANVPEIPKLWLGSAASLLFQTYIEIEDGFSTWGFDRVDFAANVAGAAYPVAQHYWPPLRDFNMKFSYHPSPLINEAGGSGFRGQKHILFDDYEGQTLWLSVNVNNLLPKAAEEFWPDWLCLAVGYGARDVAKAEPYSVYFLSFDYDMTKIIPQNTGFLRTLSEALNFIHLPAPAVRISPEAIWYGLYF